MAASRRRPQIQGEIVVEFIDRDRIADGMLDVLPGLAVLKRRTMDVHTVQSYYETLLLGPGVRAGGGSTKPGEDPVPAGVK